jgi:chitodextrinase
MYRLLVIALLILVPQLAVARVYMCVDQATGQTTFTDKACDTDNSREEVHVRAANLDSGRTYTAPPKTKTWRSQADTRKTGMDYNAERRSLYQNKATASTQ